MELALDSFKIALQTLADNGELTAPRGQKTVEFENFKYVLQPYERFCNYPSRKLNINYIKKEFMWYLRGDRFDDSICEHATMWNSLRQPDGGFNSNYGQYIFNKNCNQFARVAEVLTQDKDSRRAVMMISNKDHVLSPTSDQPCTYCLRFSIRDNTLRMTVNMRSQDAIFGMGNDAPCFSFIQEMVYVKLKEVYNDLKYGEYIHNADSFHVYDRHFNMLKSITGIDVLDPSYEGDSEQMVPVDCPKISSGAEVDFLIASDFSNIPEEFKFAQWLAN